jgi:hypothetical protein
MALDRGVILGADANRRQIISVHAKLTYRLLPSGACKLAEEQAPFLNLADDRLEERAPEDVLLESDVIPHKAGTDLIVMASAQPPRGQKVARMLAGIECGTFRRQFLVHGDRRVVYRGRGSFAFSDPEPFERMPLRYERAYGGCDPHVPVARPQTVVEAMGPHPGIYPRNTAGRGYVVVETPAFLDGLQLPNVEDPAMPLRPDRLVAGAPENWWRQPLPWSCDWFDATWYPRSLFFGGLPEHLPEDDAEVEEVRRGYVPGDQNARMRKAKFEDLLDPRLADAASPGMVLPFMKGDEAILLRGMAQLPELVVRLPGQRPKMEVRFEGKTATLVPVPNRVLISLDEGGVYIVWHGAFAPPRPLPESLPPGPEPPSGWDLAGVEAFVDGALVPLL